MAHSQNNYRYVAKILASKIFKNATSSTVILPSTLEPGKKFNMNPYMAQHMQVTSRCQLLSEKFPRKRDVENTLSLRLLTGLDT